MQVRWERLTKIEYVDRRQVRVFSSTAIVRSGLGHERVTDLRRTIADTFLDGQFRGGLLTQGISVIFPRRVEGDGQDFAGRLDLAVVVHNDFEARTLFVGTDLHTATAAAAEIRLVGVVGVRVVVRAEGVAQLER